MSPDPSPRAWLDYMPLLAHVVPTLGIGFGLVIPGSPIEGWNAYTTGFAAAVLGFVPSYAAGLALVKRRLGAR
jgi:hypothetical protein